MQAAHAGAAPVCRPGLQAVLRQTSAQQALPSGGGLLPHPALLHHVVGVRPGETSRLQQLHQLTLPAQPHATAGVREGRG